MDRLISYCLDKGDLALLWAFPRELIDEADEQIVGFIKDHTHEYGTAPTKRTVAKAIDAFLPVKNTDTITKDILSETVRRKRDAAWRAFVAESDELEDREREEATKELLRKLSAKPISVHEFSTFDRNQYFDAAKGNLNLFTPYVTAVTGGISKGELAFVIGRYGVGKTLLVQHNILSWYLQGKKTLILSNDMPSQILMGRFDTLVTGIDLKSFKRGKVDRDDIRLEVLKHVARNIKSDIIIPKNAVRDTNQIFHLQRAFEADAVVIDGVYLMNKPMKGKISRSWESLAEVSGELRQLTQELKVPIIGITQANKEGEVAYSQALAQDSDLIVNLKRSDENKDDDDGRPKPIMPIDLSVTKNRSGSPFTSKCIFDFQRHVLWEQRTGELV